MYAFPECRYVENGWQISTVAPNKGLADQVKKLILQTSSRVPGAPFFYLARGAVSTPMTHRVFNRMAATGIPFQEDSDKNIDLYCPSLKT